MINIVRAKGGKQRRLPLDVITLAELRDYVAKHTIASDAPLPHISAVGLGAGEAVWSGDRQTRGKRDPSNPMIGVLFYKLSSACVLRLRSHSK